MQPSKVYAGRYHRFGGSRAVIINKELVEALMLKPDDLMLMSVYGSHLIMRRVDKRDVVDVDSIPTGALPGAAVSQVKNAG